MKRIKKYRSVPLQVRHTGGTKKSNGKLTNGHANGLSNGLGIDKNSRSFETRFEPRYKSMPPIPENLPAPSFSESSNKILIERYLLKGGNLETAESVSERFWHIAYDIASADFDFGASKKDVLNQAKNFYSLMVNQRFLPNSPTIMNAGKQNGLQYSACFVLPVADSITEIFDAVKYAALIHQSGGGTGFSFSRLRPNGSVVKTTGGVASGPVSFLRVFNAATESIKQGGTRRGANMGILRVDHPDILEFIRCKAELDDLNRPVFEKVAPNLADDEARAYFKTQLLSNQIANFNISVAVTDKFMDAYYKGEDYNLIDPQTKKVVGHLNAKEVFEEIIERAWHTGDPGVIFLDRINHSPANPVPELEEIEATNPCVTGDTMVATIDGWKRADQIKLGDAIGTVLGSGIVDQIEAHERKPVYRVKLSDGGELKVTADHQFHAIKVKDRAKNSANKHFDQISLKHLEMGDVVRISPAPMPDRAVADLPEGWKEKDYGFFIGMLLGDGCITEKSINRNVVKMAVNTSETEWVEKVQQILKKAGSKVVTLDAGSGYSANLTVQSMGGVLTMVKQSFLRPSYSYEKSIPAEYINTNRDFLAGLLDGLWSTDGNVNLTTTHPQLRFKTTSKQIAQDIRRVLLLFGIHGRIATINRVKDGLIDGRVIVSKHQQYEVHVSGAGIRTFAQQIGLSHPDKQKKLQKALLEYALTGNTWLAQIVSIKEDGVEKVYDLHEPTSDTWITDGVVSRGCGEQPLAANDACNLGSINLGKFVLSDGSGVDWENLKVAVHAAVHFLDNVVQTNPFTLKQIYDEVHQNRRIGLGVMGWADMLFKLGIIYNSDGAISLGEAVMRFINNEGHKASESLASVRGPFPSWAHSIYKNGKPLRNSTVTTIAPTGTISIIGDCSSGIEPVFALAYLHKAKTKGDAIRTLTIANQTFVDIAKREEFYSDDLAEKIMEKGTVSGLREVPEKWQKVFVTAQEIAPDWHVRMQAAFQKGTDNGVSKTINLPNSATKSDVKKAYLLAWETGCNGITIYRDGSKATQVLNISQNLKIKQEAAATEESQDSVVSRPMTLRGRTYKVLTPVGEAFITVNRDEKDQPFEVFVTIGKAGMQTSADAEALGRMVSLTLRIARSEDRQSEIAKKIVSQLRGIGGSSQTGFGKDRVMSLADAVGKALAEDLSLYPEEEAEVVPLNLTPESKVDDVTPNQLLIDPTLGADLCPECGNATFVFEEGCKKCHSCGYSVC